MFALISTHTLNCEVSDFKDALDIWCLKPHVVNRRLAGCITLMEKMECSNISNDVICKLCEGVAKILHNAELENIVEEQIWDNAVDERFKASLAEQVFTLCSNVTNMFEGQVTIADCRFVFRKLLPRSVDKYSSTYELICVIEEVSNVAAIFMPICVESMSLLLLHRTYLFRFNCRQLRLQYYVHENFENGVPSNSLVATKPWLEDNLVKKLLVWSETSFLSNKPLRKSQSLQLVNIEEYSKLYSNLKRKYGPYFVQIWPESTDPLKFVYEDIAIATYIMLIWKSEREQKGFSKLQSFIDLGCGNGLLVHILNQEGFPGKGVDISKRKIWSYYGDNTCLEEISLSPDQLIVDEDWIIGNHSDELTPWIPVIAAKSSYQTNYFVLPCCFHDFYSKFHKVIGGKSQYESYLSHIHDIGQLCGFTVKQDTLRIPSTKRVCQIGQSRRYLPEEQFDINNTIKNMLLQASSRTNDHFKPREVTSDPRNCSSIDIDVKIHIIKTIAHKLLSKQTYNKVENDMFKRNSSKGVLWSEWNSGGTFPLPELAGLFDNAVLKQLKFQCGGLQTLLRNNRHVFKVVGGMVCLRDYRIAEDFKPSRKTQRKGKDITGNIKTKLCWFYTHHPQGCVLYAEECLFAHGEDEIKRFPEDL